MRSLTSRITTTVMLMLIVGLFTASFNKGIYLNMHEVVPKPIDDHNKAIAVALSELKYGNLGYLGIEAIRQKLFEHGLTKKPEFIERLNAKLRKQGEPSNTLRSHIDVKELKFPEILRNARLIDLAISKADNVDVPNVKQLTIEKKQLFSMVYADLGMVDYYKLSFFIFGKFISSAYYLFFLLLALEIILFCANFRDKISVALTLLFLVCLYQIISPTLANDPRAATLFNPRLVSILAIIPIMHAVMFSTAKFNFSRFEITIAITQMLILAFVMSMRNGLIWCSFFLIGSLLITTMMSLWRTNTLDGKPQSRCPRLKTFFKRVLIIIICVFSYDTYVWWKTDNSYYVGNSYVPSHLTYHSMYISFILGEPRFKKLHQTKYLTLEGVPANGLDSMAFNRSWSHLVQDKGYDKADFIDPNSGTFRMRLHEQTIKGLLIEEVFARPSWFINSKSNLISELYEKFLKFLNGFKALVIIAIVTTAALIAIYRRELTAQYGREAFACVCIAPFFSSLPYVIAYPRFPVDFFILNTISIIVICGICLAAIYLRATRTFLDLQSRL